MLSLLLLLACTEQTVDTEPLVVDTSLPDLEVPELDADLEEALADALMLAVNITASRAWDPHLALLEQADAGCPDLYAGVPDEAEADDEDIGVGWADWCAGSDADWRGWAWWMGELEAEGDAADATGLTRQGERMLWADATIAVGTEDLFSFSGEVEETLYRVTAPKYDRWTWSSTVDGRLTGSTVFDEVELEDGVRTDLYLYATGGDTDSLELRGNTYWYNPSLHETFDSLAVDLTWTYTGGSSTCALEPEGWIGLRTPDAVWFDVVFQPTDGEDVTDTGYENDPYDACDGCGTLFVRGLEQGEVCPDLTGIFADGVLEPPEAEAFVFTLRDLDLEAP